MTIKQVLLLSFLSLMITEIFLSCAQIVAPNGGKKDTLAPIVVKLIPENQTKNFKGKQIDVLFNEFVSVDNIQQQLSITPNIEGTYETKIMPKGARLIFNKPFKENTTYSFNFRNTFKDMNERNEAKNVRLVFSTGNVIDSLKISGRVENPLTNKPMLDVSVGIYIYSDTLNPKKIRPYYFMKTDSAGKFTIDNVAAGKYRIYAITDTDNNLLYDEAKESLGIIADTITLKSNLANIFIKIAKMEKIPNKVLKVRTTSNYAYIDYYRGIKQVKIDFIDKKDSMIYQQIELKNIRIFNTNKNYIDTLKVRISVTDSLDRVFTHEQKIKFKEKPKKNDGIKEEFAMKTKPANNEDIDLKEIGYTINFTKPVKNYDLNKIEFLNDTIVRVPITEKNIQWNYEKTELKLKAESKKAKEFVRLKIPKGAFISVENDSTQQYISTHQIRDPENYGTISGQINNPNRKSFYLELLNEQYQMVQRLENKIIYEFTYVKPGSYFIRLIVDENRNGKWDAGDLDKNLIPEIIKFAPDIIKLRQNFELTGYDFVIE